MSSPKDCDCSSKTIITSTKKSSKTKFPKTPYPYPVRKSSKTRQQHIKPTFGEYFYTDDEEYYLKKLKTLAKLKKHKNSCCRKYCCCRWFRFCTRLERAAPYNCNMRVQIWEKHDIIPCPSLSTEYKYVGEIIYPVCSRTVLDLEPGVPIRRSNKCLAINCKTFGESELENRKYAYSEPVLDASCAC